MHSIAFNIVITVPAEISRGPFRKSYRNSFLQNLPNINLTWRLWKPVQLDGYLTDSISIPVDLHETFQIQKKTT